MAEYDLICDVCGEPVAPSDAILSWREDPQTKRESDFRLTHDEHAPSEANARCEGRVLAWPNGYLAFFGERLARIGDGWRSDSAALETLLHALAPFVMRHDSPSEVDSFRAASFGQRLGVKPGEQGKAKEPAKEIEGGK